MHNIIKGSIEVIEQGEQFLKTVTPSSYNKILTPYFTSSSGEHMRHIIDHFQSLKLSNESGLVDYDLRNRKSDVESNKDFALQQLLIIKQWLLSLDEEILDRKLNIKTEVSLSENHSAYIISNFSRELVFITSHAVHHFSIISIAMQIQDLTLDVNFGIAPATATHLRNTEDSCAP